MVTWWSCLGLLLQELCGEGVCVCSCVCRGGVVYGPERSSSNSEDTQQIQTPYLACRACAQGAASPHACQGRLGQARPSIAAEPEPEQAGGPGQPVAHFQPCPRPACPNATWPRHASDWQAFLRPEQLFPLPCPAGCPSALPARSHPLSGCPSFPLPESLCVFLPLVRWCHFSQGLF